MDTSKEKNFKNKIDWFNEKNSYLSSILTEIDLDEYLMQLFNRHNSVKFQNMGELDNLLANGIVKFKAVKGFKHNLIFNDLEINRDILEYKEVYLSPCSYLGRRPTLKNLQEVYAIVIDLDGVNKISQLRDIFHQAKIEYTPMPNMVINSGNGLHLYYLFEDPIKAYDKDIQLILRKFKYMLISRVWNGYTSSLKNKQLLSIVQHYRIPESYTKFGTRVTAFLNANQELYTLDSLASVFMEHMSKVKDKLTRYNMNLLTVQEFEILKNEQKKNKLSLAKAKELYPEWYDRRIIKGEPRGKWKVKRALYDWWLNKIKEDGIVGHRYFCILALGVYAKKCGINDEELRADALGLVDIMEDKTTEDDNHFTIDDVNAAINNAKDYFYKMTREKISKMTAIQMLPNKRNRRKQVLHLAGARAIQKLNDEFNNTNWREGNGRPKGSGTKKNIVEEYRQNNPNATKYRCQQDTGLSKNTIKKYW